MWFSLVPALIVSLVLIIVLIGVFSHSRSVKLILQKGQSGTLRLDEVVIHVHPDWQKSGWHMLVLEGYVQWEDDPIPHRCSRREYLPFFSIKFGEKKIADWIDSYASGGMRYYYTLTMDYLGHPERLVVKLERSKFILEFKPD